MDATKGDKDLATGEGKAFSGATRPVLANERSFEEAGDAHGGAGST
jgi:hypothetical protein